MNLSDFALTHYAGFGVPPIENETTGWLPVITILQLATHTAGFDGAHGFGYLRVHPGTDWSYSNGGANWLADLLTVTYMRDLKDLMFARVFTPIGISSTQLTWQTAVNRPLLIEGITRREFGRGISASADAMARIGLLYLRNGMWNGQQIIPPAFINVLRTAVPRSSAYPNDRQESTSTRPIITVYSGGTMPIMPVAPLPMFQPTPTGRGAPAIASSL